MMDVNRYLVDRIKTSLIRERSPDGAQAADGALLRMVGTGRAVFDTLDHVISSLPRFDMSAQDRELLFAQLDIHDEERCQATIRSIHSCNQLIGFLADWTFTRFGHTSKKESTEYLTRQEQYFKVSSLNLGKVKNELLEMMDGKMEAGESRVKSSVSRYFRAILDQLKSQQAIYSREYSLGNKLAGYARKFIKENLPGLMESGQSEAIRTVTQIHVIATKMAGQAMKEPDSVDVDGLQAALSEMEALLEKRRSDAGMMERLISLVEEMVHEMEREAGAVPEEHGKKGRGMARSWKLFRGK